MKTLGHCQLDIRVHWPLRDDHAEDVLSEGLVLLEARVNAYGNEEVPRSPGTLWVGTLFAWLFDPYVNRDLVLDADSVDGDLARVVCDVYEIHGVLENRDDFRAWWNVELPSGRALYFEGWKTEDLDPKIEAAELLKAEQLAARRIIQLLETNLVVAYTVDPARRQMLTELGFRPLATEEKEALAVLANDELFAGAVRDGAMFLDTHLVGPVNDCSWAGARGEDEDEEGK